MDNPQSYIKIKGARTHNLKNVDVDIPKDKLTVITGLSGSGKSSLAFDTIYAEGQRRYVESLSAYARQFLGLMDKPDVDLIEGLSPAISIDQKSTGHNPRSTVGTVTEIYDYLRLLFARVGHPRSPKSGQKLEKQTVQQIVDSILNLPLLLGDLPAGASEKAGGRGEVKQRRSRIKSGMTSDKLKLIILSPIIKNRKGTYEELFSRFLSQGFVRARVDGQIYNLEEEIKLDRYVKHNIDLVIDRLVIEEKSKKDKELVKRITDSVEQALNLGDGELLVNLVDYRLEGEDDVSLSLPAQAGGVEDHPRLLDKLIKQIPNLKSTGDIFYSEKLVDPSSGESFPEIEPHSFSFNSPHGACSNCNGLGTIKEIDPSMIYNPRLTIKEGGIFPLHRSVDNDESFRMSLLNEVAKKHKFSLTQTIGSFKEDQLNTLLYGDEKTEYTVNYKNSMGRNRTWTTKYEGVIPFLMRRYEETDSDWVRNDIDQYMLEKECPVCKGYRLRHESLAVTVGGINIVDVTEMSISETYDWISGIAGSENKSEGETSFNSAQDDTSRLPDSAKKQSSLKKLFDLKPIEPKEDKLTKQELEIGTQVFKEISSRLNFLLSVGLDYLTLSRKARTLSGGEAQRIRLASQIGTGLTGVLYVLDEPSIGLHQRDNEKLIKTLENLREIGNTVVVVEHDEDTIRKSDYLIDIGPAAGEHGGEIVIADWTKQIINNKEQITDLNNKNSITLQYLGGEKEIKKEDIIESIKDLDVLGEIKKPKKKDKSELVLTNVKHNNLKGFDFELPLGNFVCVTGVSGSGKSSMVNDVLYRSLAKEINGASARPGEFSQIRGIEHLNKLVNIDQSPIGRTPRSNPATYTGLFTHIRDIFAQTKEAKARGYKPGRFSFNVKGGRCEKCQGAGVIQISMQFLPDVYVTCDVCDGQRYNRETLQIDYKGKNIAEVLDMTVEEGLDFFSKVPKIKDKLQTLNDVGLSYIRLGQGATTLSGGESQRVKLASELSKRATGQTLYILDEPTTGLHFEDVRKLLVILHGLVAKGNTVLVIEHNLDVIKTADWIIDLGPEGGEKGGYIIAQGTVEDVMKTDGSYTGEWLGKVVNN